MAIIIPFADPDAHGSIAGSVSFRRRRGKVVFQKKPHGKQPNTPAQQAQKTKFSDGWKAYHQLNAWEIEYLTNKAAELNTTKANLFLSQYLLDETPSTNPQNQIKEVLNLSLPDPVGAVDQKLLEEFFSQIDDPLSETLLAHIYDKENIVTLGSIASAHDRSFIRIENKTAGQIIIPFDYPIILDYIDQSDTTRTQLIRLPAITMPTPGTPSTTKWITLRNVDDLNIPSTQQAGLADMQIELHQLMSGGPQNYIIGAIDDNRNTPNSFPVLPTYSDMYIEFADNKSTPILLTSGFLLDLDWLDDVSGSHNDQITFPRFQNADGGAPSTSGSNDVRDMNTMNIKYTQAGAPTALKFDFIAAGTGADVGKSFGNIYDNQNSFNNALAAVNYTVLSIKIDNTTGSEITLSEGYSIMISFVDATTTFMRKSIVLPQLVIPASSSKTIYLSSDYSVYDEVGLTTLLLKGYINTTKLWLADDFSMYWDQALTNLAYSPASSIKEIFLATDFSTYFDEALTQLGNTPFY